MWTNEKLLAALQERGIRNVQIERTLNLPASRVSEIRKGQRRIQLDEAALLVEAFGLDKNLTLERPLAEFLVEQLTANPRADTSSLASQLQAFLTFAMRPEAPDLETASAFWQGLTAQLEQPRS